MPAATAQLHDRRPATPPNIAALRRELVEFATRAGATDRRRQDIALAVSEALTNVVAHAYADDPRPGAMAMRAAIIGDELVVDILDDGVGMPPPTGHPSGGLGLAIIARATDRLELSDTTPGTHVQMTFSITDDA